MTHDSAKPLTASDASDAILAAASYQVPLLWLALFSTDNITSVDMPLEDVEGHESIGAVPTLLCPTSESKERYASLKPRLLNTVPAPLHPHIAEWETLLSEASGNFLQVDVAEIWMMFEEGEFETYLRSWIDGIAMCAGDGWSDALGQANLPPSADGEFDVDVARFGLRGYRWHRRVPWTD